MESTIDTSTHLCDVLNTLLGRIDSVEAEIAGIADDESAESFWAIDSAMCGLFHKSNECMRYAVLHSPSDLGSFSPSKLLARYNASAIARSAEPVADLYGDARQIAMALQWLVDSVEMETGAGLQLSLYAGDNPRYTLMLSDGAELADPLTGKTGLEMRIAALNDLWAAATDGGIIEKSCGGLAMYLSGEGVDSDYGDLRMRDVAKAMAPGVLTLKSWRTISGAYEGAFATTTDAREIYGDAARTAQSCIERAISSLR